jgi:hypothetical protein
MSESFDPYAAWLGITDPRRPPSQYQLLGIPNFEGDLTNIRVHADASLARINSIDPGPNQIAWNQVRQEMFLAKMCLCDPARKRNYDEQLRQTLTATQTAQQPAAEAAARPTAVAAQSPAPTRQLPSQSDLLPPTSSKNPMAFLEQAGVAQAPAIFEPEPILNEPIVQELATIPTEVSTTGTNGPIPVRNRPMPLPISTNTPTPIGFNSSPTVTPVKAVQYDRSHKTLISPDMLMLAGAGVFVLALAYVGISRLMSSPAPTVAVQAPQSTTQTVTPPAPITPPQPSQPRDTSPPVITKPTVNSPAPPPSSVGRPNDNPNRLVAETDSPMVEEEGPAKVPPESTDDLPNESDDQPQPAPSVDEPEMPEDSPTPPAKTPEPSAPNTDPPAAQSPEAAAAFEEAAVGVRAELAARNLPQAKQHLAKAMSLAASEEQSSMAARLEMLFNYVEGFWQAVVKAMAGLQATDVIPIGNTEVAVVEVDEQSITLRAAGRNIPYTLANMPHELALLLAERWFDRAQPANKLYLGAFLAVEPKADKRQARRLWEEAAAGGADSSELLPLLDLPNAKPGGGKSGDEPPLARAQVAQARKALRAEYAREFKSAVTPALKRQLAGELLSMAEQTEDRLTQCALLEEALPLAIQSHGAVEVQAAVEALAELHQLNVWDLMAASLSKAVAAPRIDSDDAKRLAEVALEHVPQAAEAEQADAAKSLATAAATAARKAKDVSLLKQAEDLKAKFAGDK